MPVGIVGMHRSGTSMVAHLLQAGGLYLGAKQDILPGNQFNTDGYYEHAAFVLLNDAILRELGGAWDLPPELPEGAAGLPSLAEFRGRAAELCGGFVSHEPWGWKDPRTSLLLPLWFEWLPDLRVVVCVRNPLEVADSLFRRQGYTYPLTFHLWRVYNERIVRALAGRPYLVTSYDAYFTHPRSEFERLFAFAGLACSPEAVRSAETIVSAASRHSRFTLDDLVEARCPADVVDLYARLVAEAASGAPAASLASRNGVGGQARPLVAADGQTEQLSMQIAERDRIISKRDATILALSDELARAQERIRTIKRSRAWRLATLLRQARTSLASSLRARERRRPAV